MTAPETFDFLIIGGGSAGFAAATRASELGLRIVMVNSGLPVGGTCVNVGCIPSKYLLAVSDDYFYPQHPVFAALASRHASRVDFGAVIQAKRDLVAELRQSNYADVLGALHGVEYIEGRARFHSPGEVEVNGRVLAAEKVLLAMGARPSIPLLPGIENVSYLTNREAMDLEHLPASMVVVGAGPVGLELGQMFLHFGTKVTVLEKFPQILPHTEPEIAEELQRVLEAEGMEIACACTVERVWQEGETRYVQADVMGQRCVFQADQLLLATGVVPNSQDMGLDIAGVRTREKGYIEVNEYMQTSAPHIYAAGDVVGKMFLEPLAAREGMIATTNAFENAGKTINYDTIPAAVFTNPQVATVGLTEDEEMRRLGACACRTIDVARLPKAKAIQETRGRMKMVIHPETRRVMGMHIVAPNAADLIHEAVCAVKFGLTIEDIIDTVHVFPTLSEGIKLAAQAFVRDISIMSCCIE